MKLLISRAKAFEYLQEDLLPDPIDSSIEEIDNKYYINKLNRRKDYFKHKKRRKVKKTEEHIPVVFMTTKKQRVNLKEKHVKKTSNNRNGLEFRQDVPGIIIIPGTIRNS